MDAGYAILAMAELSRRDNAAQDHVIAAHRDQNANVALGAEWKEHHNKFVFAAKSHVHGLRSSIHGHNMAEDQLIAALKLENADHPLASRETVDAIVFEEQAKALFNQDVIRKTYPNGGGVLPEGAAMPPNLVRSIDEAYIEPVVVAPPEPIKPIYDESGNTQMKW